MAGTSLAVVLAMERMPPMITSPTPAASSRPTNQARSANTLLAPPVTSMRMAVAWLD